MTDKEAMCEALWALEWNLPVVEDYGDKEQLNTQHKAITALRERLAQPASQWQVLTEDEIDDIWNKYCDEMGEASINDAEDIARAIEQALKKKNT